MNAKLKEIRNPERSSCFAVNSKSETILNIQNYQSNLNLVLYYFEFVSHFVLRISNLISRVLTQGIAIWCHIVNAQKDFNWYHFNRRLFV